jgi:NADH-ubiquinone oxidoreductase chain 3
MIGSTLFYLIFIPFLAFVLLALSVILSPQKPYSQKSDPFECGFSSFRGQNRTEFSVSFFIFGLIFLLLDLEILLIYPYVVSSYNNSSYGLLFVLIFLIMLTVGFVFEMAKGALKINSRQTGYLASSNVEVNLSNKHNLYAATPRRGPRLGPQALNNPSGKRSYSTKISPVKVYQNADTEKAYVLSENKHKSGIYRWVNIQNNKSYIGSAVDLRGRFTRYYSVTHLLRNDCMLICRALIKYGYSNFRLEILEYCDTKVLRERENYYLNSCNPEYNLIQKANSMPSRLGYKHREDTKLKISKSQSTRMTLSVTDIETKIETIYNSSAEVGIALGVKGGVLSGVT